LQLTQQLRMDGWPALAMHGDKTQQERDWVMHEFKSGRSPIMLATDVAARGLGALHQTAALSACSGDDHGQPPGWDG
jgi:superfamily II DNA/RNA helicase